MLACGTQAGVGFQRIPLAFVTEFLTDSVPRVLPEHWLSSCILAQNPQPTLLVQ